MPAQRPPIRKVSMRLNEACDFCASGTSAMRLHDGGHACTPCVWRIADERGLNAPFPGPPADDEVAETPVERVLVPAAEQTVLA